MKKQACGVYLKKDNKILFLVRKKANDTVHQQGIYLPIGGKVELGEGIEDCAIREVLEESGITVRSLKLAGIIYIRNQGRGESDWICFVFISTDFKGKAISGSEGSFEWVDVNHLNTINMYKGDQIYMQYILKNEFFVIDFQYKGFELIKHTVLHPQKERLTI